ncbi:DEAD/DEAH box helicase [Nocardia coubleae]|uniref:DNA helicase n=1 Tax=Nocardia coubleae TaxID=356147 RepID=A0A846WBT5_9NOCA|nr:AAA domain-containing protein [Nocardia coubleae]NKX90017.1 DNA helicase [Nocardia coubleae]
MRVVSMLADGMGCIVNGSEHAARLVRFWRTVELFGPQLVPEIGVCRETGALVVELGADEPAPWEDLTALPALQPGRVWQFVVFGGLFEVGRARESLMRAFGRDGLEADARQSGTTATFAVTLSDDGMVVEGSATLSGLAWAINRLRSPGPADPGWADGFEHDSSAFTAAFDLLTTEVPSVDPETDDPGPRWRALDVVGRGVGASLIAAGADGVVSPGLAGMSATAFVRGVMANEEFGTPLVTGRALQTFAGDLCGALSIRSELRAGGVRVACVQVAARDADSTATEDRLNSGLGVELRALAAAVERGDVGAALRDYLAASETLPIDQRIDVRQRQDVMVEGLLPQRVPDGRWPGDPLVAGQQFAVDQAMTELRDSAGIFAVHGAPGTGTTTMLRDLLAAIVVERAERLAAFDDPMDVFTGVTEQVQVAKNYTVGAHRLAPETTGFEVVLATGSDRSAADVVAEIQHRDAIDSDVRINHFGELAEFVSGEPAWGLIASALGGARRTFGEQFWFGDRFATERKAHAGSAGMLDLLKQAEADPDSVPDWQTAVRDFESRREHVRTLAQQRQDVADAVAELPAMNDDLLSLSAEIANADAAHAHWRAQHQQATEQLRAAQATHHRVSTLLTEHGGRKPGFAESLSTGFRAGRRWSARSNELLRERHDAEAEMRRRQGEVDHAREQWAQAAEHGRTLIRDHVALTDRRARALDIIEAARENWSETIPFGDVAADDEQFQLCNPWADEQYSTARRELFLSALRLHRALLLNAAPRVRDNLIVAIALIRDELAVAPKPETIAAAWQTLFLAVPMLTTTFAALPKLFAGLGREALGWLFVDDAGQAAPQAVAGGLWRARRAVIVGDHRQLGPVVTLPTSAQEALVRQYGLDAEWMPDLASARQAADRGVRFGTWLTPADYDRPVWVGTPLRVHRRSDLPIFELTHRIAYDDDLLVFGTPERPDFPGHDRWIDVRSARAEGNWIPGEGEALGSLLTELREDGVAADDIRVVSPFRDVADGARRVAREVLGDEFAAAQVGTIHGMRGNSAEVVVLVLGTSPAAGGSRRWAAANPNVLNAAVSRARRRVYVIGNYRLWSSQRYFDVLARHWPAESDQLVAQTVNR